MLRIAALLLALVPLSLAAQVQEKHCRENGTGAILTRSAFAHGYRHGYEAGYHEGNIDINMARRPRTHFKQFKGLPLGYESAFGSKKSFEFGFALGLKAGYKDGFSGDPFRAIDGLRSASSSLKLDPADVDPKNIFFDRGVTLGYQDGFSGSRTEQRPRTVELDAVTCSFRPGKPAEAAAEPSYCDGYRRGYVLGHRDGTAMGPDTGLLEASK